MAFIEWRRIFVQLSPLLLGSDGRPLRSVLQRGSVPLLVRAISNGSDQREWYRIKGYEATLRSGYSAAFELYRQWLVDFPDDGLAYRLAGNALMYLDRFPEAVETFERGLRVTQEPGDLLIRDTAAAYIALGQDVRAEAVLREHLPSGVVSDMLTQARNKAANARARSNRR